MKIKTNVDKPKKGSVPVNKMKREDPRETGDIPQAMSKHEMAERRRQSTGHFESGAAPRVGMDKKQGAVMVKKPSRVVSGIALSKKKKKGMTVTMGMYAKGKGK